MPGAAAPQPGPQLDDVSLHQRRWCHGPSPNDATAAKCTHWPESSPARTLPPLWAVAAPQIQPLHTGIQPLLRQRHFAARGVGTGWLCGRATRKLLGQLIPILQSAARAEQRIQVHYVKKTQPADPGALCKKNSARLTAVQLYGCSSYLHWF